MSQHWFISTKYRHNSKLALLTVGLAAVVILLGAFTRLTDAGLSCPDWPNCYGFITAPHTQSQLQHAAERFPGIPVEISKAWTEMVHRYFAGTEGLLILWLTASILFVRRIRTAKAIFISFALLALLATQVLLGMLTVTQMLRPIIVSSHLITGLAILSLLWWSYLDLHLRDRSFEKNPKPGNIPWIALGLTLVAAQISLGGWVSTHYAGLACIDLPYCNGQLIPSMQWNHLNSDLISIHMLHRFGAIITGLYIFGLAHALLKNRALKNIAIVALLLLAAQISLGVLNIVWLRPVWVAMLHHGVGAALLLTMITMLVRATQTQEKNNVFSIT